MNLPVKVLLLFVLALTLFGCKKSERAQRDLDSLYSIASSQKATGDFALAIESFQRLLTLDSLRATTYRLELLSLYEQTGNFRAALSMLDSLSSVDSLQSLQTKRLAFLCLLGETENLKQLLRRKFPLTQHDELLLADLYLQEKDYDRAQYHLAALSQSGNALVAIDALGKLAMLFEGYRQNGTDSSTFFLRKLSNVLTERLREQPPLEEQFELLYRTAHIFSDYDAFTSIADSLYGQALACLNRASWKGGNPEVLSAWVTLERSRIGTLQSQALEQALLTFRKKEHTLGEAFATLLLGTCTDYSTSRRIDLLLKSLELFESLSYPDLPYAVSDALDKAINDLLALLLAQERLLEAFEISERIQMLKQRFSPRPTLLKPHSPAFAELKQVQSEVFAISVMKDSLAFLADETARTERSQRLAETLSKKQGEFYQKFIEFKSTAPTEAELLLPKPLTLSETQRLLKSDDALVQFIFGDTQSHLLVITSSKTYRLAISLTRAEMVKAFKALRFELLNGLPLDSNDVIRNATRLALTNAIFKPLLPFISERSQVYVISNAPCPIHLLGETKLLGETHALSYLSSAKQLQLANFASPLDAPLIVSLDEIDVVPFRLFESPQEALLEWGRIDDKTKSLGLTLLRPLADAYRHFALLQSSQNQYTWINFSCYGK
ncbi:MAG: tetratricopeptide repeat protein [Chloroherpetonaceae bacterium]